MDSYSALVVNDSALRILRRSIGNSWLFGGGSIAVFVGQHASTHGSARVSSWRKLSIVLIASAKLVFSVASKHAGLFSHLLIIYPKKKPINARTLTGLNTLGEGRALKIDVRATIFKYVASVTRLSDYVNHCF